MSAIVPERRFLDDQEVDQWIEIAAATVLQEESGKPLTPGPHPKRRPAGRQQGQRPHRPCIR
jgi:hypothetical protein